MKSNDKGEIAQLKTELRALEKGYVVSRPLSTARYDLIVDDGLRLFRVQVKYGDGKAPHTDNSVRVSLNYTTRSKQEKTYTVDEVDAFAIYVPRLNEVLWFSSQELVGKTKIQIPVTDRIKSDSIIWQDHVW